MQYTHAKLGSVDLVYWNLVSGEIFYTQVWERITGPIIGKPKLILNTGSLVLSNRERFLYPVPHTVLREFYLLNIRNVWALGFMLTVVYGKTEGDHSKVCKETS